MKILKEIIERAKRFLRSVAAPAVAGIGLCACALNAPAQLVPQNITALTNLPSVITAQTFSNSLNSVIVIQQNSGVALEAVYNASAGTSNVTFRLYPSLDGTNKQTLAWDWTSTATGTTSNRITTNWSSAQLAGYGFLILDSITNQNNGTVTNGGVRKSQWNPPRGF